MADIFEDGVTHGNFNEILDFANLPKVMRVDKSTPAQRNKALANIVWVECAKLVVLLQQVYKVGFLPDQEIPLSAINVPASLHNCARVDVALSPQRVNRGFFAALRGKDPMPHLVLWQMPDGTYTVLDGIHRLFLLILLGAVSVRAYVVQCDDVAADLLARSLNSHGGLGQPPEYSMAQAVEYVIARGLQVGNRSHVAAAYNVNPKYLNERVLTRQFLDMLMTQGLVTAEVLKLSHKLVTIVRRHQAFKQATQAADDEVWGPIELTNKAEVLKQAVQARLTCDQVQQLLDDLLTSQVTDPADVANIVSAEVEQIVVFKGPGGWFGGPQAKVVFPLADGFKLRNLVEQLLRHAEKMPDKLIGVYGDANAKKNVQFTISRLITELTRLK